MTVNILGIQWRYIPKRHIPLFVVLVLSSSFVQAEKEPVEVDGPKSDNPPSVVCIFLQVPYAIVLCSFNSVRMEYSILQ